MEPYTSPNQVLPQITVMVSIDLGACIIEVAVFDEGAELRCPIVIRACDHLPGEIRVVISSACAKAAARSVDVYARGFGKVNADAGSEIRLEPLITRRQPQNEVPHKRASIDKASHAAASYQIPVGLP